MMTNTHIFGIIIEKFISIFILFSLSIFLSFCFHIQSPIIIDRSIFFFWMLIKALGNRRKKFYAMFVYNVSVEIFFFLQNLFRRHHHHILALIMMVMCGFILFFFHFKMKMFQNLFLVNHIIIIIIICVSSQ